jgi:AcrR family transcriptional regulator
MFATTSDMKSSSRARNTRQRILDAAQRLIEKGGFIRLTTKEIAREAGVAEGTIFKHFERKDDLCVAVVLENSPRFKAAIAQKRAGKGSVQKNLREIVIAAIRFADKLIPLAATLFADASLLARHRSALQQRGGGPKDVFDLIAGYISEEQHRGRVNPHVSPLAVSVLLFGPCFYWAFIRQGLGHSLLPITDKQFAASLVVSLMRGLSPARRGHPRPK